MRPDTSTDPAEPDEPGPLQAKSALLGLSPPDWRFFREQAFALRNKLVHGVQGTSGLGFASKRVESILSASRAVVHFAASQNADLFMRLELHEGMYLGVAPVRHRPRIA